MDKRFSSNSITFSDNMGIIGKDAFKNSYLSSVTFNEGLYQILDEAFHYCRLSTITLPNSLAILGGGAFADNTLKSVHIPAMVEIPSDAENVFYSNPGLSAITVDGNNTYLRVENECLILNSSDRLNCAAMVNKTINVPEGVVDIAQNAIYHGSATEIYLPSTLESMDSYGINISSYYISCYLYCKAVTPPTVEYFQFPTSTNGATKIYVPYASVDAYKVAQGWSNYSDLIQGYY